MNRDNIIEPIDPLTGKFKGKWREQYFGNSNPIVLELGCGRGEYTVGLAERYPDKNFIGVDVKGDRIWVGSTIAIEKQLTNVAFLRIQIQQLEAFFEANEVNEIWITFPDPRPKIRDEKRRLTSQRFFSMYKNIIAPDGIIHLKTDNTFLYEYTLEVLEKISARVLDRTDDLYQSSLNHDHFDIKTKFEQMFYNQGFSIKYLKFRFN